MSLGPRRLNRATLGRQLHLALWNRLATFDPAAFADRAVVKATLMRITLHVVHAQDHPAFHNAMVPRNHVVADVLDLGMQTIEQRVGLIGIRSWTRSPGGPWSAAPWGASDGPSADQRLCPSGLRRSVARLRGAGGGVRTLMPCGPNAFKARLSADSSTPALTCQATGCGPLARGGTSGSVGACVRC